MKLLKNNPKPDKSPAGDDDSVLAFPLKRSPFWQKKHTFLLSFGFLTLLLVGLLALGAWSWYGSLEESILGMGQLVPEGKVRRVMSPTNGIVAQVLVKENQEVKAGDVLVELDPEPAIIEQEGAIEQIGLLQAEVDALQAASMDDARFIQNTTQNAWLSATRQAYEAQKAEALMKIDEARHHYQEAVERLKQAEAVLATGEDILAKYKTLYEEGGLPAKDLQEYEQKVNSERGEVSALKETVKAAKVALSQAEQGPNHLLGVYQSQILRELSDREQRLAQLQSEAAKAVVNMKRQVITAPVDGTVNEQVVRGPGDVVMAGEPVLSLVPSDINLVAEVKVSNRDLSFVHPNQRAVLLMDALPYQTFGRLEGTVEAISPSTQQAGSQANGKNQADIPYYVLTIRPDQMYMSRNGKKYPLKSGMTLTADIITREKNILSFFMEPIHVYFRRALSDPTSR